MGFMHSSVTEDPWTGASGLGDGVPSGAATRGLVLRANAIDGAMPLDAQLGISPRKSVPDELRDALFGQSHPSRKTAAGAATGKGGLGEMAPRLATFAILDAAKTVNLPELLEDSRLEHRCLFKGAAFETLKNVAPWLVRLDEDNKLTRSLFTQSDACWHLWGRFSGMFIRTSSGFDDVWRHFRKFTQMRDEKGQVLYLRFWDRAVLNVARRARREDALYQALVGDMQIIWHSPEPDHPHRFWHLSSSYS